MELEQAGILMKSRPGKAETILQSSCHEVVLGVKPVQVVAPFSAYICKISVFQCMPVGDAKI